MPIAPPPSSQALVPAGNMFSGMSMGGGAPPSTSAGFPPQNTMSSFQNTGVGYQNQNASGMNQYNQAQYQMTPYGLPSAQQQSAPQQQLGYMGGNGYNQGAVAGGMNGGMAGGMNGVMGGGGLAGPGQMLQIQAAGFDPYHQQQQQSNDPFSAFDAM